MSSLCMIRYASKATVSEGGESLVRILLLLGKVRFPFGVLILSIKKFRTVVQKKFKENFVRV